MLSASLPRALSITDMIKPLNRKAARSTSSDDIKEPKSMPRNPEVQTFQHWASITSKL